MKQFDEEMQVKREEKEAQDRDEHGYEREEVSVFGINMAGFRSTAGIIYILVFGSVVIAGLCWGFSNLNNSSLPRQSKKEKKNKKNK